MPNDNEHQDWGAVRYRITALEYEVYNWRKMMPTMLTANLAEGEVRRTELMLATAEKELAELHELYNFWLERNRVGKIPVLLQTGLIIGAVYFAIISAVLIYLVAISGR